MRNGNTLTFTARITIRRICFTRLINRSARPSPGSNLREAKVDSARRYSLPVDTDFNKIIDLDRAFTANKTTVANGKQFIMVNIHMSAFTPNVKIQQAQFAKLFKYINHAYQQGNYVMVAGDYNHRLLKNTAEIFHTKDLRRNLDASVS